MAQGELMFKTIRQRVRRLAGRGDIAARARDASVQLRVPNPHGGKPWLMATVAVTHTPHGYGETLRLRAHMDGALRLPQEPSAHAALGRPRSAPRSLTRFGRDTAASLLRGAVARLPSERLAPLAGRRWRGWLDIQLSTSPLDAGAEALMPEPLRGLYGGGLQRAGAGEPRIGVWSGPAGGPGGGIASLAMLQLDERDLGRDRRATDGSGFSLNASLAQVIDIDIADAADDV